MLCADWHNRQVSNLVVSYRFFGVSFTMQTLCVYVFKYVESEIVRRAR